MRGSNPPPEIGNLKLISNSQNKVTEKSTDHLQPLENTPPPPWRPPAHKYLYNNGSFAQQR